MENEISKILESIKDVYIPSFEEIESKNKDIIDEIFDKYLIYKQNISNKQEALKLIEGYQYITFRNIDEGDYIKYFDTKYFYDVVIKNGGFVIKKENKNLVIKNKRIFKLKKDTVFFRKLTDEDKAKITLNEIINNKN